MPTPISREISRADLDTLATIPGIRFQITHTPVYEGEGFAGEPAYGRGRVEVFDTAEALLSATARIPLCDDLTVRVVLPSLFVRRAAEWTEARDALATVS